VAVWPSCITALYVVIVLDYSTSVF